MILFSWARELSILSLERDVFLFAFVASYQWVTINLSEAEVGKNEIFPTLGFGVFLLIQCSHLPQWLHSKVVHWLHYDFYLIENYWNFPWLFEFLVLFFLLIPWHSLILISRKIIGDKPMLSQVYLVLALFIGAGLTQSEILRDQGFLSLLTLGCGLYCLKSCRNLRLPIGVQGTILSEYWLIIFLCAFWVRQFHEIWWIVFIFLSVLVEGVAGGARANIKQHAEIKGQQSKNWFIQLAFYCFFILGCLSLFLWSWFAPFALFSLLFLMFMPSVNSKSSSTGILWSLLLIGLMIIMGYQSFNQRALVFFFALCVRLLFLFVRTSSWKRFLVCCFMLYYCVMNLKNEKVHKAEYSDSKPRLEYWEQEKQISLSGRVLYKNVKFERVRQNLSAQHWMLFNFPDDPPRENMESFVWLDRSDEKLLGFTPTLYLQDLASEVSKQKIRILWPRDRSVGFAFNIHKSFYQADYSQLMQSYLSELESVLLIFTAANYSRELWIKYVTPLLKRFPTAKIEFRGLLVRVIASTKIIDSADKSLSLYPNLYLQNFLKLTEDYKTIDFRQMRKSLITDQALNILNRGFDKPEFLKEWILILLRNEADDASKIILKRLADQDSLSTEYSLALEAISAESDSPGRSLFKEWQKGHSSTRLVPGAFLESVFFELLIRRMRGAIERCKLEMHRQDIDPYVKLALMIQVGNLLEAEEWRKKMLLRPSNDQERKLLELLHQSRGDLTATRFYRP